ncbi:MAG: type II toxin-antitoxin system PemK/MazF family toxin [Streptococcaceae bacterium]|jgi:mRNA interferase MazF|nr:type II toxin-antitoxin system PemK/MazF family toxin [Streptococcaceae bacterium]
MNQLEDFDPWLKLKKKLHFQSKKRILFKEREVWWCHIGQNIGWEENGKHNPYERPVLILKKYTNELFFGIPLSSQKHVGTFFYQFSEKDCALLNQGRTLSARRLERRLMTIPDPIFETIYEKFDTLNKPRK